MRGVHPAQAPLEKRLLYSPCARSASISGGRVRPILAADAAMAYLATQPLQSMEAIAAWNEALALAPDDRSKQGVQIHLARIHAHIGETDKAREILKAVNNPKLVVLKDEILKKLDAPALPPTAKP